jgi:sec-independent protein translocase protein TatB
MSLPDTIFIFGLALVIFGPKKLPEIGRQLGKLMLEFRRASNEFKMQIEEELRTAEHTEQQKQIVAPSVPPPAVEATPEATSEALTIRPPSEGATVSTDSPSSRVIPVHEEVAELEAVAAEHPDLTHDHLERLPEQATTHHD